MYFVVIEREKKLYEKKNKESIHQMVNSLKGETYPVHCWVKRICKTGKILP